MLISAQKMALRLLKLPSVSMSTTPIPMEDWEIINLIDQNLKQGNINNAMNFLIKSHLNGQVLDIQTFRNMHYKMIELKSDLSYQELTYKLYRQCFKPHVLMLEWMKMLSYSKDQKILKILQNDYKELKMQMPKIADKPIQNQKPSQKQKQLNQKVEKKQQQVNQTQEKESTQKKAKIDISEVDSNKILKTYVQVNPQLDQEETPFAEFATFIHDLVKKDLKIVLTDVQINCNDDYMDDEDMSQQYDEHEDEHDEYNQHENQDEKNLDEKQVSNILDYLNINKIRIGKIQIRNKNDDKNKNNL